MFKRIADGTRILFSVAEGFDSLGVVVGSMNTPFGPKYSITLDSGIEVSWVHPDWLEEVP
jgi:hypothetical protein